MAAQDSRRVERVRVNLKLDPGLHHDVKVDAAKRGVTLQEYVSRVLEDAVERREPFSELGKSA